jgi:nitrogen regulatory protein PII-like uncharacterized protein
MERMLSTTSDIGRLRRIAIETFKIDGIFLASFRIMTVPATYRLASEEIMEETIEMIIKRVVNSAVIIGTVPVLTGKIMVQDSRRRTYLPKI